MLFAGGTFAALVLARPVTDTSEAVREECATEVVDDVESHVHSTPADYHAVTALIHFGADEGRSRVVGMEKIVAVLRGYDNADLPGHPGA